MRTISAGLLDILDGPQFAMADLYIFSMRNGSTLRYTTADMDLVVSGNTYVHDGPLMQRSKVRWKVGLEVDTMDVEVVADNALAAHNILGVPFFSAIRYGFFDGCHVEVRRVFMSVYGVCTHGSVHIFGGRSGEIKGDPPNAILPINSDLELLNIKMPRHTYEPQCWYTVYGAGCSLNIASFTTAGVVSHALRTRITVTGTGKGINYYDQGILTFTSGALNGFSVGVKNWSASNEAFLYAPLPVLPEVGDTCTLVPGCDGSQATCDDIFSNLVNFVGCPHVPVPETAV